MSIFIKKKAVGYDPYHRKSKEGDPKDTFTMNAKANELFARARILGNIPESTPGACPKCGQIGHLSFQCRNYLLPPEQLQSLIPKSNDRSEAAGDGLGKGKKRKRHKDDSDEDFHRRHSHRNHRMDKDKERRRQGRDLGKYSDKSGGQDRNRDRHRKDDKRR